MRFNEIEKAIRPNIINKLHPVIISPGNRKIGELPNFSFFPLLTCDPEMSKCCSCKCYAVRTVRAYPEALFAWLSNTLAWIEDPIFVSKVLNRYFELYEPTRFRFFVGGDFPDEWFYKEVLILANRFVGTRFLVHTKKHELVEENSPLHIPNLFVYKSYWIGQEHEIDFDYPYNTVVSSNAETLDLFNYRTAQIECPLNCEACNYKCFRPDFNLIVFPLH